MAEVEVIYNGDNVEVNVSECACSEGITDYNDLSVYAVGDGVTITGDGTTGNPFVAVGGGDVNSSIFPNGVKIIEDTAYTLSSVDAGYDLVAINANTHFIMPPTCPFSVGDVVGLSGDLDFITFDISSIVTNIQLHTGQFSETGETVIMQCIDVGAGAEMLLLSSIIDDNGTLKTLNKYLYDKTVTNSGYILTGLVPYTGASGDVDLGTHGLEATKIRANDSGGLTVESNNGTDVGFLGVGNTANVEWYGSHNFSGATQDTIAAFVGSGKTLSSLALATYPSLTELSYVKGVTSAIQTQIGNKQDTLVSGTNIKTINGTSVLGSGDIVISGGGSLSALTAATGSNTINNVANAQVWQWNSLAGGIGFKLSSNSTSGINGNTILEIENSGTIINGQTTYGLRITNSKVSSSGANIGLDINVSGSTGGVGIKITNSSSIGAGIDLVAGIAGGGIQMNSNTLFLKSNTTWLGTDGNYGVILAGGSQRNTVEGTHPSIFVLQSSRASGGNVFSFMRPSSSINEIGFFCDMITAGSYRAAETATNTIRSTGGVLAITANSGLAGGYSGFTPTVRFCVKPTGAINITPITSTAASAITPAEGDIVMVSNTNGTFTSIGFWGYQNGSWQKM